MRVLMVSKACIVGVYQGKLQALASYGDVELVVVVPPFWKDERGIMPLERAHVKGYHLRVEPIALNGHFHLHYYPTLPGILREFKPDIVHIDEEPYNLATFLAMRGAKSVRARALFFSWQNLRRRYPPPFAWFQSYVHKNASYAIAGNHEAATVLREKGYRGPVRVIPQFGIDPEQFAPAPKGKPGKMPFRIGYIGRLVEEKGPQVLMQAAAGLEGAWELSYIGSGPLESQLKAIAREQGIEGRVHFSPWRPSVDMPQVYREIDVVVLPSLSRPNWKEQFGRVLTEAMACEVPVIGSDCGEIPHVMGDAGLVFPENDVSALRSHLATLQGEPSHRAELGRRGRKRVLQHYTHDHIAAETLAVYREMMG